MTQLSFKTLKDFNFQGKRALVRCDFNVPLRKGKVLDDFKIKRTLKTIRYLKEKGAKIILISHLGRPSVVKKNCSLKPIAVYLEKQLNQRIRFIKNVKTAVKRSHKLNPGDIILSENLRMKKGEIENNKRFAESLSLLGDIYVSEAFSVAHRDHASLTTLPKLMPRCIGFEFQKEIKVLSELSLNPRRPFCVIIGGSKVNSKIKVIEKFLQKADHVLLGGKLANIVLGVKGIAVGNVLPKKEIFDVIKKFNLTNLRMHLPLDVVVSPENRSYARKVGPGNVRRDEDILDIGEETAEIFAEIIKESQTIFFSGVLGVVEDDRFSIGTKKIVKAIVENETALKVAGGGDTIAFIRKYNLEDKFSFLSTGGSAFLSFLAEKKMPHIESLKI